MLISEIYDALQVGLLTAQKTGRITPDQYNIALKMCGEELFNMILKRLEETSEVSDDLAYYIVTLGTPQYPALPVDIYGYADVPADYVRRVTGGHRYFVHEGCGTPASRKFSSITFMNVDQFYHSLSSELLKPRPSRPIATQENLKFRIAPAGAVNSLVFTYIKKPTEAFFDYNISTTGKYVFLPPGALHDGTNLPAGTPSRSVELTFNQSAHYTLYQLLMTYFAIPVEAQIQLQTLKPQR